EGTIDRDGCSPNRATLSARLVAKAGALPSFEVSGVRTNSAALADQLADKVLEALKLGKSQVSWDAADESRRYLEESKWALRWNLFSQARSAAESAWALGNHTEECAISR